MHAAAPRHPRALRVLYDLATGAAPWALPQPCVVECLRVVTHRAFQPAVPPREAWRNLESLLASPSLQVLTPTNRHFALLREVQEESGATGDLVFHARIVALCIEHGVREILTADRDFRRFTGIRVTDPFA
jgi:toxin-antitoxin system PIN domain toxin